VNKNRSSLAAIAQNVCGKTKEITRAKTGNTVNGGKKDRLREEKRDEGVFVCKCVLVHGRAKADGERRRRRERVKTWGGKERDGKRRERMQSCTYSFSKEQQNAWLTRSCSMLSDFALFCKIQCAAARTCAIAFQQVIVQVGRGAGSESLTRDGGDERDRKFRDPLIDRCYLSPRA